MAYPESNEQFNRQQGEELIAALTGEEAPDLGYPAANEQFNREQGDRLIEAVKNFSPSGGLPDPSALTDGTAMVAVNGEWKTQEGYGYTSELAFEPIEWDGNTEERNVVTINGESFAYKVSDVILTAELLNGASATVKEMYSEPTDGVEVYDDITGFLMAKALADEGCELISGAAGEYSLDEDTLIIPSDGTYFTYSYGTYITSLTAQSTVYQFDEELIPDKPAKSLAHEELGNSVDIEEGRIRLYNIADNDSNAVNIMNNYVSISNDDHTIMIEEGKVSMTGENSGIIIGDHDDDGNPYIVFSRGNVDCKLTIDVTDSSNPKLLFDGKELAFVTT